MGSYRILQRTIPAVCDSLTAVLGFIFVCVVIHGVRNQVTTDDDSFPTMRPTFTSNLIKRDDVRSSFSYSRILLSDEPSLKVPLIELFASVPSLPPTKFPTVNPSVKPSTISPSQRPTVHPSLKPSVTPSTIAPSRVPTTSSPSYTPSIKPSMTPTRTPSQRPTGTPTHLPSSQPSSQPSSNPTNPTGQPSRQPTSRPSRQPSSKPSKQPTSQPSSRPSAQPSTMPTNPTAQPTSQPTNPTSQPSSKPSRQPSCQPTGSPTTQPSSRPTFYPSGQPTSNPSNPSSRPTSSPTGRPEVVPHYVEDNSGYYLNLWLLIEFGIMIITLYSRYVTLFLPEKDTTLKIKGIVLVLKTVNWFFSTICFPIAIAGFIGEQLREDYSTEKQSSYVANRLCLYVSSILFWMAFSCFGACCICADQTGRFGLLKVILYLPTILLAACLQSFFYLYYAFVIQLWSCIDPDKTEKILQQRREVWNNHKDRNFPVVVPFLAVSIKYGMVLGICGLCFGFGYVFGELGPGILFDGIYTSQMLMPPLLLIMFVSAVSMLIRVQPQSITTVCAPIIGGKTVAIFLLINKLMQVVSSVLLDILRLSYHYELSKAFKMVKDFRDILDLYLVFEIRKMRLSILQDFLNRSTDTVIVRSRDELNELINKEKSEIEVLQSVIEVLMKVLAEEILKIFNRLEGYDVEEDNKRQKGKITGQIDDRINPIHDDQNL